MRLAPDEVARRHRSAVERALRGRHDELTARRDALRAEPKRVRADLARLRLTAGREVTDAVRRLRDDAWGYLEAADRDARAAFPELLAAAATELTLRVRARLTALGLVGTEEARPVRVPRTAVRGRRASLEDRLTLLVGASGGLGLGRLMLVAAPGDGAATPLGLATVSLAVGLGVAAACWLTAARRAVAERARLRRWAAEALADLRAGLDAALSERLLAAERRLDRAVADRAAMLDAELREHERLAARWSPPGPAAPPSGSR